MTSGALDPRQNDPLCHPVRDNGDGTFTYKCQDNGYTFIGPPRETATTEPLAVPPKK